MLEKPNNLKPNNPSSDDHYEILGPEPAYKLVGVGQDPEHGIMRYRQDAYIKPLEEVEQVMVKQTDGLIGIFDGHIEQSEQFLTRERRYDGPIEHAIYLDKSARPVRALVDALWDDLSDGKRPSSSFLNIDKEEFLLGMGVSLQDFRSGIYTDPKDIDLAKLDEKFVETFTARIRALYLQADSHELESIEKLIKAVEDGSRPLEDLQAVWRMPTMLDGKHVAIVDEVASTKATLTVSNLLIQKAIPEAQLEPVFWEATGATLYHWYDASADEIVYKIADSGRPVWYKSDSSDGRGGIENKNPEISEQSTNTKARLGKFALSLSYSKVNRQPDVEGVKLRRDIKRLRDRLRSGQIKFQPNSNRENYFEQMSRFSHRDAS